MIISIDIETAPGVGFETYEDAALDHHRNRITQIAWVDSNRNEICLSGPFAINDLNARLAAARSLGPTTFIGHNLKFDLKTLITKGANISINDYGGDTMLQAVADPDKIPVEYLADYEKHRKEANEKVGKAIHREARHYSLKTLAPFHLGVDPFWEVDGHDNAEYALKDARYTLALYLKQENLLKEKGAHDFYDKKLMRWARMILEAELKGIMVDIPKLDTKAADSIRLAAEYKEKLIDLWQEPFLDYEKQQRAYITHKYEGMKQAAIARTQNEKVKESAHIRYGALRDAALEKVEPFNMGSPAQLKWLLRDYFGLNIDTFEGDESTGKPVLKKLVSEGRKDIEAFLELRKHTKLSQAFFPSYKEMQWDDRLYCSFNLNGARTGRLSSSGPNLQQVPGDLHELFIAGPGRKLITKDLSNIEPILIAYLTECPELCNMVIAGRNFHNLNVRTFFNLDESITDEEIASKDGPYANHRKMAKELGLLLLYGGGKRKVKESAQKYGFMFSMVEATSMYDRFRKKYQIVFDFKKNLDKRLEAGEAVKNLMGRQYKIADPEDVYMKGFNTLIQGSASDLLLESSCRVSEQLKASNIDAYVSMWIHDEIVVNTSANKADEVSHIILEKMLNYALNTTYGPLKLKAEGKTSDAWEK